MDASLHGSISFARRARLRRPWAIGAALLASAACGHEHGGPGGNFTDGAPRIDAGPDGAPPDAAPPIDAPADPEGPQIEVLSPESADDFASDSIVTTGRFTVVCRVRPNLDSGIPIDSTSVRAVLLGPGGMTRQQPAVASPTQDEFVADVAIDDFANGDLIVRCVASDTDEPPRTNSAQNATYLDLGPEIGLFSPTDGAPYAGRVDVVLRVDPAPVDTGDTGAAVDTESITLTIAGELVPLTGPDGSGVYTAAVSFDDPRFDPALDGPILLEVRASNTRAPDPITRVTAVTFVADSTGPVITISEPTAGQLIGGVFTVTATIEDDAGIDSSTVVATLAHELEFPLEAESETRFTATFDSRALDTTWVFPLLEVRAQDSVGNQSVFGQVLALDNRPPIASLDPPQVREAQLNNDTGLIECSDPFDPLGSDSADDGEAVAQLSELRVRIEDRGNGATAASGVVVPIAGIALPTVQMFVQDVTDGLPLLVDTDGDGACDNVNPLITPTSIPMTDTEAAAIDLLPIDAKGRAPFDNPPLVPFDTTPGQPEAACSVPEQADPPPPVCVATPLGRIIKAEVGAGQVIFGIAPLTELACLGNAFDSAATNINDGWACIAVRAEDALGNVGISPPLRICFDADGDEAECAPWGTIAAEGARPRCTDGCELPYTFADDPGWQLRRNDL